MTGFITVVVPTHARPDLLREALRSVALQSFALFECIVVSDHQPEFATVRSVVDSMADARFTAVANSRTPGANASRNIGIERARGDLIAFLDDDDLWHPQKLAEHRTEHARAGAGLVFSDVMAISHDGARRRLLSSGGVHPDPHEWLIGGNCPPTSSCVSVERNALLQAGLFDEELSSLQDWDMWLRLAPIAKFSHIPKPLAGFRQHEEERTSVDPKRRLRGIEQIGKKWGEIVDISAFVHNLTAYVELEVARREVRRGARYIGINRGLRAIGQLRSHASLTERCKLAADLILRTVPFYGQTRTAWRYLRAFAGASRRW